MPSSAIKVIRTALAELGAERERIEKEEAILRETLVALGDTDKPAKAQAAAPSNNPEPAGDSVPTVREVVKGLTPADGTPITFRDIVEALRAVGNTAREDSLSSILSRMVRNGELASGPRRGTYRAPDPFKLDTSDTEVVATSSPAKDGPEAETGEYGEPDTSSGSTLGLSSVG